MTSTHRYRTFYQRNMHVHMHVYRQWMSLGNITLNLVFKTLTCKMCSPENKIQIWLHSINACLRGEWWSRHWQKYLLHLRKKERKHFALIFILNLSQAECTRPDIKRSIAPYNRLKNHITNYRNKKISIINGTRIKWSVLSQLLPLRIIIH